MANSLNSFKNLLPFWIDAVTGFGARHYFSGDCHRFDGDCYLLILSLEFFWVTVKIS
jgi:hypothetical protein